MHTGVQRAAVIWHAHTRLLRVGGQRARWRRDRAGCDGVQYGDQWTASGLGRQQCDNQAQGVDIGGRAHQMRKLRRDVNPLAAGPETVSVLNSPGLCKLPSN